MSWHHGVSVAIKQKGYGMDVTAAEMALGVGRAPHSPELQAQAQGIPLPIREQEQEAGIAGEKIMNPDAEKRAEAAAELLGRIEPDILPGLNSKFLGDVLTASIAISLRRIADKLDWSTVGQ